MDPNAAAKDDIDFDDTEFVVGSDSSGVPPAMKNQFQDEDDGNVEIDTSEDTKEPVADAKDNTQDSSDDLELEIVDDTPPEDRNRKPLPEEVVEELEQDAAEEYSAKVKQRIDQLKKAWHDERRAKEAAAREREAAAEYAQRLQAERDKLRNELSSGETWALQQAKERAALALEAAKRKYRDAYEQGDSEALTEAQEALSKATYQAEQVNLLSPRYSQQNIAAQQNNALQQTTQPVYNNTQAQPQVSAPEPDDKAKAWGDRNEWFGKDDEMTSFALGVHQKLVKDGIPPSTDEYYERIDARMREVFPDRFEDAQPSAEKEPPKRKKRQPSTVVAPAGRTPKGKKVVLTQSQVAMAKKLGISPEAYAREVQKLEANNG